MSFYFDDDNDAGAGAANTARAQGGADGEGNDNFVCFNCGSTDAYFDSSSGEMCCTHCYTQSQTTVRATQEELDVDEVMGMVARDRGGRILSSRRKSSSRLSIGGIGGTTTTAFPMNARRHALEPMNRAVPLPELEDCLRGMQRVLKATSRIICDLARPSLSTINNDNGKEENCDYYDSVLETIKTMWSNYLRAWAEGAEYYGAIYPEVRFCLRDSFCNSITMSGINAALSYRATQQVLQNRQQQQQQQQQRTINPDYVVSGRNRPTGRGNNNNNIKTLNLNNLNNINFNVVSPDHDNDDDDDIDDDPVMEESLPSFVMDPTRLDDDGDSSIDSDLTETNAAPTTTASSSSSSAWNRTQQRRNNKRRGGGFTAIQTMLAFHVPGQERTFRLRRKEAALVLTPSMTMVATMLWMAVSPLGVSDTHVMNWIANGSLPLINAFSLVLPPEEQRRLAPIADFFRMKKPPTSDLLQRTATTLQVACGYQPPLIRVRSAKTKTSTSDGPNNNSSGDEIEETAIDRNKKNNKRKKKPPAPPTTAKPGRMLTPASVPMMTARFVSDLEFGQQVLNYSLALMGLPFVVPERHRKKNTTTNDDSNDDDDNTSSPSNTYWMPPSLKAARPDLLVEPSHILGVIVVACRLVPGWDCWSYTRPLDKGQEASSSSSLSLSKRVAKAKKNKTDQAGYFSLHQTSQDDSDDGDDNDDKGGQQREAKRRKVTENQRRFVPWNEAHFRLLGNGKTMEGYLEFLEETIVNHTDVVLPEFVSLLDLSDEQSDEQMSTTSSSASQHSQEQQLESGGVGGGGGEVVRPCPILVTTLPENNSSKANRTRRTMKQGQDGGSNDVDMPPAKKAQQHRYELLNHRSTTRTTTETFTPCSPHIGMLIEYMAYKVGVQPFEIEQFCITLDKEIASRFAKHPNVTDMHPLAVFHMADGSLGL